MSRARRRRSKTTEALGGCPPATQTYVGYHPTTSSKTAVIPWTHELYLPALLGGPEQVSATSEAAGGDSRRGDSAAPAATELNYRRQSPSRPRRSRQCCDPVFMGGGSRPLAARPARKSSSNSARLIRTAGGARISNSVLPSTSTSIPGISHRLEAAVFPEDAHTAASCPCGWRWASGTADCASTWQPAR